MYVDVGGRLVGVRFLGPLGMQGPSVRVMLGG
jgi:hypothetical protein